MSYFRGSLQAIDINVIPPVSSKDLLKPRAVSDHCSSPSSPILGDPICCPLSYDELRRRLRDALMCVELLRSCCTAERHRLLHAEFSRLLSAATDEALAQLSPLFASWANDAHIPLSYRVLETATLRRRALCCGFGRSLCDLKEWLRLAALLGEPQLPLMVRRYAAGLSPGAQRAVEDTLLLHGNTSNVSSVSRSDSELELESELEWESGAQSEALVQALLAIPSAEGTATPFDARYFSFALDDLIARADVAPLCLPPLEPFQPDAVAQLRESYNEWLLQVCIASRVHWETFFLSLVILDRCLDPTHVGRSYLQLVSCAALLLSSKQEERIPVAPDALVRHGGGRFRVDDLVAMECELLQALDFNVVCATLHAVGIGLAMEQEPPACEQQRSFLLYVLVTLAVRTRHGQFRLSALAAAAVYLSRVCFRVPTGGPSDEVSEMLPHVLSALRRNRVDGGVFSTFSRSVFHEVTRVRLQGIE